MSKEEDLNYDLSYLDDIIKDLKNNNIKMTEEIGIYLENILKEYEKLKKESN